MRDYAPRLLLAVMLATLLVSPRPALAEPVEARQAIQSVLDQEPPRPVRGLENTARRYVDTVREADGWVLASIMPVRPNDAGDKLDAYLGDVELALAWQEGGLWKVSFEADTSWQSAIQRAPFALLNVQSKKLMAGWATQATLSTKATVDWMFPWPVGETWIFTQGPHGAYNGALDFGNVAPAHTSWVVAPADGVVIGTCGTSQVVMRFDDGRALGFYHLTGRPANIYVGARITRGTRLGHPGTNVDCGGSAIGPHLHLFAAAPTSIVGASFNGYVVTDDGWFSRDIKKGRLVGRTSTFQICVVNRSRCAIRNDYRGPVAAPPAPAPAPPAPVPTPPRPAPTPPAAPPAPAVPVEPGIVVKDKDDANVERGGTQGTLVSAGAGAMVGSGHATWTSSSASTLDNFVKWKPPLDRCGRWEVFAFIPYIPNGRADTTNAVYTIRSRAGTTPAGAETTRSVNVEAVNAGFGRGQAERWHSLGTYVWSAAANTVGEYVQLGDVTGEPSRRNVSFDDLRWVYKGAVEEACSIAPPAPQP